VSLPASAALAVVMSSPAAHPNGFYFPCFPFLSCHLLIHCVLHWVFSLKFTVYLWFLSSLGCLKLDRLPLGFSFWRMSSFVCLVFLSFGVQDLTFFHSISSSGVCQVLFFFLFRSSRSDRFPLEFFPVVNVRFCLFLCV
jgi:hypothetical protein